MAVAWDYNLTEKRAEKLSKYDDLRTDLRRQYPGYRLGTVPVVIGGLDTVTHQLVSDLDCFPTAEKTESQIEGMQRFMLLCGS